MKTRKSSTYLIISSSHLGIDDGILAIFGRVAHKFNALTYHIGELESKSETTALNKIDKRIMSIQERISNFTENTKEETEDKARDDMTFAQSERDKIIESVIDRIASIKYAFGDKIKFLIPEDSKLASEFVEYDMDLEFNESVLSKYLLMSAVQPVSDVSTIKPTSRNAIQFLKQYGNKFSWIVPHPVPAVIPYPRPGLNNTHNYYAVGGLIDSRKPTRKQNIYAASHAPAALLVVVDDDNGEFHASQLHVDFIEKNGYKKDRPVVLYDGLCFSKSGVTEVQSSDRAVFITDEHQPKQHAGVLGSLRALNNLFRPETFINGGDASDCDPVNPHTVDKPGASEGLRISDMLCGLTDLLASQTECSSIKNRILIDSNHHEWISRFVERFPQLIGLIDWPTLSTTILSDWSVRIRQGDESMPYMFGDYTIRHGDQEAVNTGELIFENGKYLCGHWHRYQAVRRMVYAGCGSGLNPEYMKAKITNWQNQITSLTRLDGVTAIAPKIVLHDQFRDVSRFVFRNKIIEVNRYYI